LHERGSGVQRSRAATRSRSHKARFVASQIARATVGSVRVGDAKKMKRLKANKEVGQRREGSKIDALAARSKFVSAL
jgi:hypothetical protein